MSRWVHKRAGRKTRREQIEGHNRVDAFYAAAAGTEPKHQLALPKRRRPRKPEPGDGLDIDAIHHKRKKLERSVNDEIYAVADKRDDVRLWRNNRGVAQYGNSKVRYGVGPNGASDWIGYRVVFITQDMVGHRIAQFMAIEAKRPGETPEENQQRFMDSVAADGGCAGCARSGEDADRLIDSWPLKQEEEVAI